MRAQLWPDAEEAELAAELPGLLAADGVNFVAEDVGKLVGFIEVAIRNYAEGAPPGPAAYVEGIWVDPGHRRRGVARALLAAGEAWARASGLSHLGSDALIDNELSHLWHRAAGFDEIERIVIFGKPLG
jgi:aminoglycoside 6'-N-acetyltransferase I